MSSEWSRGKLGDFIELKRGYDLPKANREIGSVPLVSSAGVSDQHNAAMVKGPGVVTGRYGTIGQVFYVAEDFWPLNTTLYVRDFKGNDPKFIHYFLKTLDFLAYSDKAAVPGVNRNHLHEALVAIPTTQVQLEIASFLGALDDRITLLRETNATLEAIAQALFKSWFVDFDPVRAKSEGRAPEGMIDATAAQFPDSFEESALGLVPKGWAVREVGDVVEAVGGATPDTKNPVYWEPAVHDWTTPKDLSGLNAPVLLATERRISPLGLAKIGSGLLPPGTLLMSSRAPIGYLAISQVPVAINQGYIAIPPGSELPPLFMLFWCQQNMDTIKGRANGSTFMEISKKAFRPIPLVVPPATIVSQFQEAAEALFSRLVENAQQAQTLATLRDTLLPRLISGQLRLPEASAHAAEPIAR
jgi:type I restriction enzyme S subunit